MTRRGTTHSAPSVYIYVAYNPLNLADPSAQGYIGIDTGPLFNRTSAFANGTNVTSIALQLGTSANDSKLSLNSIDWTLLQSKQTTTKTRVDAGASCVRLPVARSNFTVDDCTFTPRMGSSSNYEVSFDSTVPVLKFERSLLRKPEDRFLANCTVERKGVAYSVTGDWERYICPANIKLPTLMIQLAGWEFYLDPVDYTTPANATTTSTGENGAGVPQIKVLIGRLLARDPWVLGTPYLRKFPIVINATEGNARQYYNLYCTENTACRAVPERVLDTPSGGGGGGDRGGGGGRSGGGAGGGGGVGGNFGLDFECCRDEENEDEKEEKEEEAEVEAKIEVTMGTNEEPGHDSKSKEKTAKAVAKKHSVQDANSDSSSSESSSSYDSESSEERRKERRRRRRRRRERRRARKEKEAISGAEATTVHDDGQSGHELPLRRTLIWRACPVRPHV